MDTCTYIATVAAEFYQYYELICKSQFMGVSSGTNLTASNYFGATLNVSICSPSALISAFRDLSGALPELVGYLATQNPFAPSGNMNNAFSLYTACSGTTNTQYMLHMGRFHPNAEFAPLAKIFSMRMGSGPRPTSIPTGAPMFQEIPAILPNSAYLYPDGSDMLFIQNGSAEHVQIASSVNQMQFFYNSVKRSSYPGVVHNDAGIGGLILEGNDGINCLHKSGVIDCQNPLTIRGKDTSTVLSFTGCGVTRSDQLSWTGIYTGSNRFESE